MRISALRGSSQRTLRFQLFPARIGEDREKSGGTEHQKSGC
jgi:hypothetical protein